MIFQPDRQANVNRALEKGILIGMSRLGSVFEEKQTL
jgi:hypothetical protein